MDILFLNISLTRTLMTSCWRSTYGISWVLLIMVAWLDAHLFPVIIPCATTHPVQRDQPVCPPSYRATGMNLVCEIAPATVTTLCQDTKETPISWVEVFSAYDTVSSLADTTPHFY